MLGKELRERFQSELAPSEKAFFLRKAREAIAEKGYRAGPDLFHYCWFLTLKERLRRIRPHRDNGHLRLLLIEGVRDVEEAVRLYRERLEAGRLKVPDAEGERFLQNLKG